MDKRNLAKQFYNATHMTVQAADLPDDKATLVPDMYEPWAEGKDYTAQEIVSYGKAPDGSTQLYRVITDHKSQADWTPDATESLYTRIDKAHAGTAEDPIPWRTNMVAEKDKYYVEGDLLCVCIEDSGIALQQTLAELADGRYFLVVDA